MKVALAQINTKIGDFPGNRRQIVAAVEEAAGKGANLIILPEMAVTGYPPRDLLLDPRFVDRAIATTEELAHELAGSPPVLVGTIMRSGQTTPGHPGLWNVAALLANGIVQRRIPKQLLPIYDVYYEPRWFVPGPPTGPLEIAGRRVGVLICEDLWDEGYPQSPAANLRAAGAELIVTMQCIPFRSGIVRKRLHHARRAGLPVVFVNAVGGNDELVFDGGSFVLGAAGKVVAALPRFAEAVEVVDLDAPDPRQVAPELGPEEEIFRGLVLGVRDFAGKNGLQRIFFGLSGGVDSALVALIAAQAIGAERVTALVLPSRHTDPRSTGSARELAAALGIGCEEVGIDPLYDSASASLAHLLGPDAGTTEENLQARLRALILGAYVNRRGGLLLNTSNKTELSLGYGTLYGDLAGALSVIGDLTKPAVYAVARWASERVAQIPPFILERPPSAELKPEQVDPFDYPRIAPVVETLVQGEPVDSDDLDRWRRMLHASEHKRWQHGVVLKVTEKSFGTGRMIPITRAVY